CFSVYQSFVPLYISAASATFLLIYRRYYFLPKEQKPQNIGLFRICLKILAVFVGAFILYTIINKITAAHYGGMNAYISGQIMWGHLPVSQCIHHVLAGIYHILSGQTALYNLAFPLMALILIIVSLIKIRHFYKGYALYLLITAIFILSPFFMIVLMGAEPAMRTQFSLPFVVAFGADFLISLIPPVYKKVRAIIALFCVLITFDQASVTSRLFYTEYARYQKDVAYCTQIANSIDKLELTTTSSLPVVFVGGHHIQLNQDTLPVEGVGTSTLEIESFSPSRTLLFMKTLGYNYIFPTSAQYEKGHQLSTDMPIWPAEGSVQIKDNLVVIRLS
ncbi:MAG TPA: hypothetical protein DEP42_02095, partial [Ruminococcaceae bacterium]|nr:hypothetical protein [Oscillospiraceae bacterium]